MPDNEVPVVDDLVQAIGLLELVGITAFGLSVERTENEDGSFVEVDDDDDSPIELSQMQVFFRDSEEHVSVRIRTEQPTPGAVVNLDLAVAYRKSEPFEMADSLRERFIQMYAVHALFPYIRMHVQDLTTRIGVPAVLPLVRLGSGSFSPMSQPSDQPD